MTDRHIKYKSIVFVLSVMFFMLLIIAMQVYVNEKRGFELYIKSNHDLLRETNRLAETRTREKFVAHLSTLQALPELKELIKKGEREKLYRRLKPVYESLQLYSNQSVNVYHFYLNDGTSFLRLHKPDKFGDNNYDSRPLLRKTILNKEISTGYEIGKFGLFYRIEYPITEGEELISVVDLGIYFKELDIYLESVTRVKSLTILGTNAKHILNTHDLRISLDDASFITGDEEAAGIVNRLKAKKVPIEEGVVHDNDSVYAVHILDIRNEPGELIAKRIYFIDVTTAYQHRYKIMAIHLLISLIALLLTAIILNNNFGIIIGKLIESENRFKSLFDNMRSPIVVLKADENAKGFVYKDMNQSAQALIDEDKEDLLGQGFTDPFLSRNDPCLLDILKEVNRNGIPIQRPCVKYEEGHIKSWHENYVYKLAQGDIVLIRDDISQQKKVEESKQNLQRSLKQKNLLYQKLTEELDERIETQTSHILQQSRLAQMGEMISMIAHQWRQPLASISAISGTLCVDAMMDKYRKEFFLKRLDEITELSTHLSSTIDDFRGFFKEEKETEVTTLKEMTEASLRIISPTLEIKGIAVETSFDNEERIRTYNNEVNQVILNIMKNAEDILVEKQIREPTIRITGYTKDEMACLSIHDNAGGVPEELMSQIFEPYFSTKLKKDGTGLGLYMSKTIIEEHCRGEIRVENIENGACFTLFLPYDNKT